MWLRTLFFFLLSCISGVEHRCRRDTVTPHLEQASENKFWLVSKCPSKLHALLGGVWLGHGCETLIIILIHRLICSWVWQVRLWRQDSNPLWIDVFLRRRSDSWDALAEERPCGDTVSRLPLAHKRGLRRNQACWHLELGLLTSGGARKQISVTGATKMLKF